MSRRIPFLIATALLFAACGDDDAPPSYELTLAFSTGSLPSDGTSTTALSVIVRDEATADPAPVGDFVPVQCQTADGDPALSIDGTVGEALLRIGQLGIAEATVACSPESAEDYDVICLAIYEGESGISSALTCRGTGG